MDMDKAELDHIQAERHKFLTPPWFGRLLRGQLSVGDTFWVGNFGVSLITMPAMILGMLVAKMVSPTAYGVFNMIVAGGLGLYHLGLTRALWIAIRKEPQTTNWKWVGLAITLYIALMYLLFVMVSAESLGLA